MPEPSQPITVIQSESTPFPQPENASPDGLLAIGGNLSPQRLETAYRSGIFPWSANPVTWWSPDPRAIFDLHNIHVSRRLRQLIRQNRFTITFNQAFTEVMHACSLPASGREESWITPEFIAAYTRLHHLGKAHSIEAWQNHQLVGGLYGVAFGSMFAGESMFHHQPNASKVVLIKLLHHLRDLKYTLFDSQTPNPHTLHMGAITIPRKDYLHRLQKATSHPDIPFTPPHG